MIRPILLLPFLCGYLSIHAQNFRAPYNSEPSDSPLTSPKEALDAVEAPEGYHVSTFAHEPDVQQPIALTTDARGRLWIAENYTYSESALNFDLTLRDRIVILDDENGDGICDRRTVFWDQGQRITGVELGLGGAWVIAPPQLLFIPDRDHDDIPDSQPEIMLDGFDSDKIRHNLANGIKWGPDGWLYGRHGILTDSLVGVPGAEREDRTRLHCGIWRWHPRSGQIEMVAEGTTNPWGHDWNDVGELFFINTVIGHLWHAVPGSYFERMYGEPKRQNLYRLIPQTADHVHWDSREQWMDIRKGMSDRTSELGGGHAHSGFMIYLGDQWPATLRGESFAISLHGQRINHDHIERRGAGYKATHRPDFAHFKDPWFRGIDLTYGPDGSVYVLDWSDVGECHENTGVHRSSGRIYKIAYRSGDLENQPEHVRPHLRQLSTLELAKLQVHPNDWWVRQARMILRERFLDGVDMSPAHAFFDQEMSKPNTTPVRLRILWAQALTDGIDQETLIRRINAQNENMRAWSIRLLADNGNEPTPEIVKALVDRARKEDSGLTLLYMASVMRHLKTNDAWMLANIIGTKQMFADDPQLPALIWHSLEPKIVSDTESALNFLDLHPMPDLARWTVRRLTQEIKNHPGIARALLNRVIQPLREKDVSIILHGMSEALQGWSKADQPDNWEAVYQRWHRTNNPEIAGYLNELAVVFGDGRIDASLMEIAGDETRDIHTRRNALDTLAKSSKASNIPFMQRMLQERKMSDIAVQGLSLHWSDEIGDLLTLRYGGMSRQGKDTVIESLISRTSSIAHLLKGIQNNRIPARDIKAFERRRMVRMSDSTLLETIRSIWPESPEEDLEDKILAEKWQKRITGLETTRADLQAGRELFSTLCGTCHKLRGAGGELGPDLTGSDRTNLDYLLENILFPRRTVPDDYRMLRITMNDGRSLDGLKGPETQSTLVLKTPTQTIVLEKDAIQESTTSNLSLMPEGLLEGLDEQQMRDLFGYLMQ